MRHLPPVPWADVLPGTVVVDLPLDPVPRTVLANIPYEDVAGRRMILFEGRVPYVCSPQAMAQPVELDAADAIGTLHAAGLTIGVIE
jgi:hypothetical protein